MSIFVYLNLMNTLVHRMKCVSFRNLPELSKPGFSHHCGLTKEGPASVGAARSFLPVHQQVINPCFITLLLPTWDVSTFLCFYSNFFFILLHISLLFVNFNSCRSELENLSNNFAYDVIGLVTFVGRVERVRSKGNKGRMGLYFLRQMNLCLHSVYCLKTVVSDWHRSPLSSRKILDVSLGARSGWNVWPAFHLGAVLLISAWNFQPDLSK